MVDLWVEKYRPDTLDAYVWQDATQRAKVEEWIAEGALPHLLFSGVSGTGKTSLALLLLRQLNIPKGDILMKNASGKDRKVDALQDDIINFGSTWSLNDTGYKYVLLDEADSLTPLTQRFLRAEMESHNTSTRFILTCNYPQRIIPAIHGRVQEMKFSALDRDDFVARVGEVLVMENVQFEIDDLLGYVNQTYPDLRKCIGLIQQNTIAKKLNTPKEIDQLASKDYLLDTVDMFRRGEYLAARKLIVTQAQIEEYPDIYRFFYQNLELWGSSQKQQDSALLIIRDAIYRHALVCDAEINLAACLCELNTIATAP